MYLLDKEKIIKDINHKTINQIKYYNVENLKTDKLLCYITLEFLIEELDTRIKEQRKKATSITSKLICVLDIVLKVYVDYHSDNSIIMKEDTFNKLIKFKDTYEKANKEKLEDDIKNLDNIDILLNSKEIELFEGYTREVIKEIVKESKQEVDFNSIIKELRTDLKNVKDTLKDTIKKKEKLEQQIALYPPLKQLNENQDKLEELITENNILKNKIIELTKKIEMLKKSIASLESANEKISSQNKTIEEFLMNNNIVKKNKDIDDYFSYLEKRKKENQIIDNKILNLLSTRDYTIQELINCLKKTHKNINREIIYESFNRLKNNYSIIEKKLKEYEISYLLGFNENNNFIIETKDNCYEIIAVSDLHISDNKSINNLNYVYDYAIKNGVKTIINLGDIFDPNISFPPLMTEEDQRLKRLEIFNSLIENSIRNLPEDQNIKNLILGGNHDRIFYSSGIDSINRLTNYRKDYINLGYDHSVIRIKDDRIGLHHFDKRIASTNFIDKFNIKEEELVNLLNSYYINNNSSRKNIALDLLGHYHVSKLSQNNSYIVVPSLNRDHVQNGAWRIKFYFDSKGKIVNIVFIPLIVDNKVYESSSITLEKIKKR